MKPSKEIDFVAIAKQVLQKPRLLAKYIIVSAAIGVVVALCTPKEYTASVVLAPELSSGALGLGGDLADMASNLGIDLGSGGKGIDAIYPDIYPEIFTSYAFIHSLFDVPIRTEKEDSTRTYVYHITKESKVPFWQYPRIWLHEMMKKKPENGAGDKEDPFKTSKDEAELCEGIASKITCLVDKKTSVITLSVKDQDPLACAILADTIQRRLQKYITDYRTKKARNDYDYYKKLYQEAKVKYDKAQSTYVNYSDANQEVVLERFQAKRDELENNMQMAFNNLNQLNTQVQTAEARIQERTPAFTVLSEAKMQHRASSTPRLFVVIGFVLLGCMADVAWTFYRTHFRKKQEAETLSKDGDK